MYMLNGIYCSTCVKVELHLTDGNSSFNLPVYVEALSAILHSFHYCINLGIHQIGSNSHQSHGFHFIFVCHANVVIWPS